MSEAAEKSPSEQLFLAMQTVNPILKNSKNPFHKNRYANLEACLDAVKEALFSHDLFLIQSSKVVQSDNEAVILVEVVSSVVHKSGVVVQSSSIVLPLKEMSPQGGAALNTYGRRYSLKSLFALAEEDDDGNAASGVGDSIEPLDKVPDESKKALASVGFTPVAQKPATMGLKFK